MNIMLKEKLVNLAMREAQKAGNGGNFPFGAVMADETGRVIASAHNSQNTDRDPTAHAEINLIRDLAKTYSEEEFGQLCLVSNAESCSMCFSAAIKAGIRNFIFGAPSEGHMEPFLTVAEVMKYCRVELDVTFGILETECREQIRNIRKEQGILGQ